jgi:hypothetical protein
MNKDHPKYFRSEGNLLLKRSRDRKRMAQVWLHDQRIKSDLRSFRGFSGWRAQ